jgi:hypothetical protein
MMEKVVHSFYPQDSIVPEMSPEDAKVFKEIVRERYRVRF